METYRMQEQEMPYRDEGSQANEHIYNSTRVSMPAQTKKRKLTASALLYLFLSFPLGLIYFILVIVLLSVGFGTIIVWVGLPLLLLLMLRGIATLQRDMAAGRNAGKRQWRAIFLSVYRVLEQAPDSRKQPPSGYTVVHGR